MRSTCNGQAATSVSAVRKTSRQHRTALSTDSASCSAGPHAGREEHPRSRGDFGGGQGKGASCRASEPDAVVHTALCVAPVLTKEIDRLILQIQREVRARDKRRRAVRIVAASWPTPTADDFGNVASRVASISCVRIKRQYRLMRRALAQLCLYTSARVTRRRQLHIKRLVVPGTIT